MWIISTHLQVPKTLTLSPIGQNFRKKISLMQHCIVFRKKGAYFSRQSQRMSQKCISAEDLGSCRQIRAQVTGIIIFLNYDSFSVGKYQGLRVCSLDDKVTFSVKRIDHFLQKIIFCFIENSGLACSGSNFLSGKSDTCICSSLSRPNQYFQNGLLCMTFSATAAYTLSCCSHSSEEQQWD